MSRLLLALLLSLVAASPARVRRAPRPAPAPPTEKTSAAPPPEPAEPTVAAAAPGPAAAPGRGTVLRVSSEMSGYADTDAVYVASPTISVTAADDLAGWSVGARYLVDAVSAASVDIVSTASGKWTELRHVGSADVELKGAGVSLAASGSVSREPDYLSIGGGGVVSFELLDKTLTPFVGGSFTHDDVGRTGLDHRFWNTQTQTGAQAGATIVVDRGTIFGFTADAIFERGYLAKPYRYVPLFAPDVAPSIAAGASTARVNRLRLDERPIDAVPDARDRFALTGKIAHRFDASTIRFDQRVYRDSWGLLAATSDARFVLDLGSRFEIWPHVRLHAQNAVDFWQRAYTAVAAPDGSLGLPRYRSGDRELGPLGTLTLGLGVRWRVSSEGAPPWVLFMQTEGMVTRYWDALYITERRALFTTLGIELEMD